MTTTERRPHSASDGPQPADTHGRRVVAGPPLLADQDDADIHRAGVGEDPNFPSDHSGHDTHTSVVTGESNSTISHKSGDAQWPAADGGPTSLVDHPTGVAQRRCVGEGSQLRNGQQPSDTQATAAVAGSTSPRPTRTDSESISQTSGPATQTPEPTRVPATSKRVTSVRVSSSPATMAVTPTASSSSPGNSNSYTDHSRHGTHSWVVGVGLNSGSDHRASDTHGPSAATAPTSPAATEVPTPILRAPSGTQDDGTMERVRAYDEGHGGEISFHGRFLAFDETSGCTAYLTSRQRIAIVDSSNVSVDDYDTFEEFAGPYGGLSRFVNDIGEALGKPVPTSSATDQDDRDTQPVTVGGAPCSDNGQVPIDTHGNHAVVAPTPPGPAMVGATPNVGPPVLADPLLELSAAVLDDLERVRIANENRLRQLTRDVDDKDGEERGFGLTLDNPDVLNLAALVRSMRCDASVVVALIGKSPKTKGCCLEHDAERELTRKLKKHPLGPWFAAQRGVGPKQAARLIASIGDPYIRPDIYRKTDDGEVYLAEVSRPRLVSELWSYTGYGDSQKQVRRKGQKANWSSAAKMRAFNIVDSCIKQVGKTCEVVKDDKDAYLYAVHAADCTCSPYRVAYDIGRAKYAGSVHPWECDRCSPKGKPPALAGSPRSPKHVHQAAVRLATKELLRDLWREAARLHRLPDGHCHSGNHSPSAVGGPTLSADQLACDTQGRPVAGES